ncbi:MAG: glycosyltransferase [Anaerolineae bacterium]
MLGDKYDVSLVVACYNEEPVLVNSVKAIVETFDSTRWSYELIFVDDASRDRTRDIIDDLLERYRGQNFRKLFHKRNRGRGRTVADGIRLAQGRVVGYIDIDLEIHARYIPAMVTAIHKGADVATAHRIYKVHPRIFFRFVLSAGYIRLMQQLLKVDLKDTETGFKFFRRDRILPVLDEIEDGGWFWDTEVMVRSLLRGYKIVEIPCLFVKRYDIPSTVKVWRDTLAYLVKLWRFRGVVAAMRRGTLAPLAASLEGEPPALDITEYQA